VAVLMQYSVVTSAGEIWTETGKEDFNICEFTAFHFARPQQIQSIQQISYHQGVGGYYAIQSKVARRD